MRMVHEIVVTLAPMAGRDSELLSVDAEAITIRKGKAVLRLPTTKVVQIWVRHKGAGRTWQLKSLLGQIEAETHSAGQRVAAKS